VFDIEEDLNAVLLSFDVSLNDLGFQNSVHASKTHSLFQFEEVLAVFKEDVRTTFTEELRTIRRNWRQGSHGSFCWFRWLR